MWTLTQAARVQFERAHLLVIRETDEEWEQIDDPAYEVFRTQFFTEMKEQLFDILPKEFHPAITDGSLNRRDISPTIRTAYLNWQREQTERFEALLNQAYTNKQQAIPFMPTHVQQVFLDSLHDFRVMNAVYSQNSLHIDFDTSGGFSAKSFVSVTLKEIVAEQGHIETGDYYVYDELIKTNNGIAWRVLLNSEKEWTIEAKEWDARFYFKPITHFDFRESHDFNGYIQTLNVAHELHFISPALQTPITSLMPFCTEAGALTVRDAVYIGETYVADTLGDCIPYIHSKVYEDPTAIFSEPVVEADLLVYALSNDLENKVRAWNTMFEHPQELAPIINQILLQLDREQEDEMLQYAYVNHFSKAGVLTATVYEKFRDLFE